MYKRQSFDSRDYFYVRVLDSNSKKLAEYKSMLKKDGIDKKIEVEAGVYFLEISTFSASKGVRGLKYLVSTRF